MTKFVPISSIGEDAILSPEFYVALGAPRTGLESKGGLVPLLPPLDQVEVIANATLLSLFDSEIATSPKGTSFVVIELSRPARLEDGTAASATLRYYQWSGSAFDTRQVQVSVADLKRLSALIEEEGILSKHAADAGIIGALPNLSSILSAIESVPLDILPLLTTSSFHHWEYDSANSPFSEAFKGAFDEWLATPRGHDGILLKDAADTEQLREALLFEAKSTPVIWGSYGAGKTHFMQAFQSYLPCVALVKHSPKSTGTDFCLAFMSRNLSRDTLVQFMDAYALRVMEQQNFLERCWQIIGAEISSRVKHMFKNRIGSAYDEIHTLTRVATEGGWLSAPTESPEVIKVLKEKHHDSDDYCQVGASLGRIHDNLKVLERAVDLLSKFYRGIHGSPELMSVNAAIELQLSNWRAARPDVLISKELDPVDPVCLIVPGALSEILDNLFGNSQKFIPREPGHHIFVTTSLSREKVVITIANDGPSGLPDQSKKFFVTTDAKGTGVGLRFVNRLVAEAGGTFSIFPRADGPGVVNRIELPNPKWKSEP